MSNPIQVIIKNQEAKKHQITKHQEAKDLFKGRVRFRSSPRDVVERNRVTALLKTKGFSAKLCMELAFEISKSEKRFLEWEKKVCKWRADMTLEDVVLTTNFSKILVSLRELYATDIAEEILYDDAVRIAIDDVLFRPSK